MAACFYGFLGYLRTLVRKITHKDAYLLYFSVDLVEKGACIFKGWQFCRKEKNRKNFLYKKVL